MEFWIIIGGALLCCGGAGAGFIFKNKNKKKNKK